LFKAVKPFILQSLKTQLNFGISGVTCWVLGKKNADFLAQINRETGFFKRLIPLDHPRYIVQYKGRYLEEYVSRYLEVLG
jgi:hypothetical protein